MRPKHNITRKKNKKPRTIKNKKRQLRRRGTRRNKRDGGGMFDFVRNKISTAKNYGRATVKGVLSVPTFGLTNTFSGKDGSPEQNWYTYSGNYTHDNGVNYTVYKKHIPENFKVNSTTPLKLSDGTTYIPNFHFSPKNKIENVHFTPEQYKNMFPNDKEVLITALMDTSDKYKKLINETGKIYATNTKGKTAFSPTTNNTTLLPVKRDENGNFVKAYDFAWK